MEEAREIKFEGRISKGGKNYLVIIPKALNIEIIPLLNKTLLITLKAAPSTQHRQAA